MPECGGTARLTRRRVASFSNSEFWDAESQATVIFNSFVGAACIVEYKEGCGEILRANDRFFEETGLTGDEFRLARLDVMKFMRPEDRALMAGAIDDAAKTDREAYCETRWERRAKQSGILWFGIRMRVIAHAVDRCIIYATIENVTRRKEMEAVLRAENEKNRLLIDFMDAMVFDYDYDTDTMIYKLRRHDSGFTTVRRERYWRGWRKGRSSGRTASSRCAPYTPRRQGRLCAGSFDYAADDGEAAGIEPRALREHGERRGPRLPHGRSGEQHRGQERKRTGAGSLKNMKIIRFRSRRTR
ncbi:MAG: PAS domain-containing protein [Cloacibacillus evryensis]